MLLDHLTRISEKTLHVVTPENPCGKKGGAAQAKLSGEVPAEIQRLGQTWFPESKGEWGLRDHPARGLSNAWKIHPFVIAPKNTETVLAEIDGPGVIRHIWFTTGRNARRDLILRIFWDGEKSPSVEAPLRDFFCTAYEETIEVHALPIDVNPSNSFNVFFPMPFRKSARITIENRSGAADDRVYYAISYTDERVGPDAAYFHAQFNFRYPAEAGIPYPIAEGIVGGGHYVGTFLAWRQNSNGWWGEGEVKFYLDGDRHPSICSSSTENYAGGAWCFSKNFSSPFFGYPQGTKANAMGERHAIYRFHIMDPVYFKNDLNVTVEPLGYVKETRSYRELADDLSSVAYWYQTEPHNPFPVFAGTIPLI